MIKSIKGVLVLAMLLMFAASHGMAAENTVNFIWEYSIADEARIDSYRIYAVSDPDQVAADSIPKEARALSITLDDGGSPDCRDMYIVAVFGERESEKSNIASVCPTIPAVINFSAGN